MVRQHRHFLMSKSLDESKMSFIGVVLVLVMASVLIAAGVMWEFDSSHTGGAQKSLGVGAVVSQVWIANDSNVYVLASFSGTGNTLTIATPQNFTLMHMVVFTKNPTDNSVYFVNNSFFYYNLNIATSVTGGMHTNLTAASIVVGQIDNSTQTNAISDKGYTDQGLNMSVYGGSVNDLNVTTHMSAIQYTQLAALAGSGVYVGYIANFNTSKHTSTVSSSVTVSLTAVWYSQTDYNFYIDAAAIVFGIAVVAFVLLVPRSHIFRDESEGY